MNWVVAVASAALLVLLFPPFNFSWAAPFALAPLLFACTREVRWKRRLALGYLCGILYWFGVCYWIQETLANYAGVSSAVAWLLFVLFCVAKAFQMGLFGLVAGTLMNSRLALPVVAALWVALEWTHGIMGFQWLTLGNAGADMSVLLRLAPQTGVWGISFAIAMMSAGIASLCLRRSRLHLVWLLLLPALVILPEVPGGERGNVRAVLLQPNLAETTVWTPELVRRSLQKMTMLSLGPTLKTGEIQWMVWPEDPGPFYDYDPRYMDTLRGMAATAQATVVAGAVGRSAAGAPLNSAVVVSPDGRILSRYSKINLVPFGEFVPWPFKEVTHQISTEAGDFEPGHEVIVTPSEGHKEGTFICYEAVFPGFIRQFVNKGAEVLFNISNDGWFGKSAARHQHLQIVRMRAAENQRWILRATNDGVTVAIDPAGRVMEQAPEYIENASLMRFRYRSDKSLYTQWGDWFVLVCGLVTIGALLERYVNLRQKFFHNTLARGGTRSPSPAV